jgi:plastocyanin
LAERADATRPNAAEEASGESGRRNEALYKGITAIAAVSVIAVVAAMAVIMVVMVTGGTAGGGMMNGGMNGDMMGGMMGGGSDPSGEAAVEGVTQVRLENIAFSPANIVIEAGTTVTWTNYDSARHTVTSDEGDEFASPTFGRNGTFSYTFDVPGEYYYHCEPHPNMKGLVTVRPG